MKTLFKVLPMIAIVAALALSAFTSAKPVAAKNTLVSYFWYPVNAAGQAQSTTPVDPSAMEKTDAIGTITDCNDTQTAPCLRGSASSSLALNTVIPLTPSNDNRINRN